MQILDGKKLSISIKDELKIVVSEMILKPKMVIFVVGEDERSKAYIKSKIKFGQDIGALVEVKNFPVEISGSDLINEIKKANADESVDGIILQMPVPDTIDSKKVIDSILPHKDVDGLTSTNTVLLYDGKPFVVPATARGVVSLLRHYGEDPEGKHVVVLGRSKLAGKAIAQAMLANNATVTICHSKTKDLQKIISLADIVVSATGVTGLLENMITKDQIIVDVGISVGEKGLVGDISEEVKKLAKAYTPVPKGVGPMTVASLFQNLYECSVKRMGL